MSLCCGSYQRHDTISPRGEGGRGPATGLSPTDHVSFMTAHLKPIGRRSGQGPLLRAHWRTPGVGPFVVHIRGGLI